jgi:hypothetical protein
MEFKCRHCGEAIERRDGEWLTKYGNDPQCDESPNDNHEKLNPLIPQVRRVPAKLYRTPSGRLHLYNRCSGGASPATARVVVLSQTVFEKEVFEGRACRCVNAYKREDR